MFAKNYNFVNEERNIRTEYLSIKNLSKKLQKIS